jgi:hypothetical protein
MPALIDTACGDGKIDKNKGESCDPLAAPIGCDKGKSCCPVCCNCFKPCCDPAYGEYATREECERNCKDGEKGCYINYHTGCWDCVERYIAEIADEHDNTTASIWKANETRFHDKHREAEAKLKGIKEVLNKTGTAPFISSIIADERINVYIGNEEYYAVTVEGEVIEAESGGIEDPTVKIFTDSEIVELITSGELKLNQAFDEERVRLEGVGFFNSLKIGMAEHIFDIYSIFE